MEKLKIEIDRNLFIYNLRLVANTNRNSITLHIKQNSIILEAYNELYNTIHSISMPCIAVASATVEVNPIKLLITLYVDKINSVSFLLN